ncbi:hypothetical protein [Phycisphaera mikurensis]|uniref:Chromosome partition protein Smc n=1 Tax=Phycisphaera mikurensis (strain NBRC 102666 / KCTC 22515 / FYK2301M01) TaxID=1142394 RepID=I0IEL3_PHYMF|nr:hypothetical protein [Phycisphaera mikurensis]MBB6441500.1 chromosome segregation ATPase [Phycisphaera mikurensis]BAM03701.1 hypothetical protein PSMK_15420 [Phycisphaera mikurensis NBRC 102666]
MKISTLALTAALAVPALGVMPACNMLGGKAAPTAAPTITSAETLEGQLDRTDAAVVSSLAALDRLRGEEIDKSAAFEQYTTQVAEMKADQAAFNSSAAELKDEGMAYQQTWMEDANQIQDSDLRRTAMERQMEMEDSLSTIDSQYQQTRQKLNAYVTELTGIQTYLKNDMTPEGIEAISSQFDDAQTKGDDVRGSLDKMQEELLKITNMLDDEAKKANMLR